MINFVIVTVLAYLAFLGIAVATVGDDDGQKKNTPGHSKNTLPAHLDSQRSTPDLWFLHHHPLLLVQLFLLQALVVVVASLLPPRLQALLLEEVTPCLCYRDK